MANPTQWQRECRAQAAEQFRLDELADECRRAARAAAIVAEDAAAAATLACPIDGRPITEDGECPKCGRRVYA